MREHRVTFVVPPPHVCFHSLFTERNPFPLPLLPYNASFVKKKSEKHTGVKRKHKEEIEGVHDNASAFMHLNIKTNND